MSRVIPWSELVDATALKTVLDLSNRRVLAGVSGGADSVCMLHLLAKLQDKLGFFLCCVTVNHGRRPEADEECRFVEQICRGLDVPFYGTRVRCLPQTEERVSEQALRTARYAEFESAATQADADVLALGHTSDDLVETMLLNLLRGCSLHGFQFTASAPWDGRHILRPLWKTPRSGVEEYLKQNKLEYRDDHSNRDTAYTRNRVRHVLLPMLRKEFNPSVDAALLRLAESAGEAASYIAERAQSSLDRWRRKQPRLEWIPAGWLRTKAPAIRSELLHQWLLGFEDFTASTADLIQRMTASVSERRFGVFRIRGGLAIICTERLLWRYGPHAGEVLPVSDKAAEYLCLARSHQRLFGGTFVHIHHAIPIASGSAVALSDICGNRISLSLNTSDIPGFLLQNRKPGIRIAGGRALKELMIADRVPAYLRDLAVCVVNTAGEVVHVLGFDRINGRMRAAALPGASQVQLEVISYRNDDSAPVRGKVAHG